ncbi:hypothetical protein LUZ62_051490 [Rhynchospora pubera]|uniref:DUF547 domain-containing protein n=1 Tax=Rhynchospora pubera TaxID=906938 RepID=A0AAV8G7Y2_9POAL|nr:hypothetical protein LUZ62_051490 [Rhynchospora pubera]
MGKEMEREVKKHGENAGSCSLYHRRSKSASDRNSELSRHEAFQSMEAELCESQSQSSLNTMRSNGTGGSLNQDSGSNTTNASPNHRVSLENDIKKLQSDLHQEKSTRYMLEKAIGRGSCTLSPGHRNFSSQTRELIEEIEMLEEEIANREQHVLSLYRSIFDECMSLPSSSQSSGVTSPAHAKVRKHPTVISSAFCSSKKFPLQHLQVLTSIKESGKGGSGSCVGSVKSKIRDESSDSAKLSNCGSNSGRSSIGRTLKDHLHQCPNKISEEMVKCLAAMYCKVSPNNSSKEGLSNALPASLSRSATSVTFPRRSRGEQFCLFSSSVSGKAPSGEYQPPNASHSLSSYRMLVEQLEGVDLCLLQDGAKTAFWINVYNSLIMHAYLVYGTPQSPLRRTAVFHKAAYNIGGHMVTADSIESSFLGFRTPRVGRWFENILSSAMRRRSKDEKHILESKLCLLNSDPRVLFTLCTGASSDPMVRMYTVKNVATELENAKREYIQANVVVKSQKKILLPRILERYAKEASVSTQDLLQIVSENVDSDLGEAMARCMELNKRKKTSQLIEWLPYNTRFMYIFNKDLIEKT